jgi:hypothetical protein
MSVGLLSVERLPGNCNRGHRRPRPRRPMHQHTRITNCVCMGGDNEDSAAQTIADRFGADLPVRQAGQSLTKLVNSFLDLPLGVRFSLRILQPINDTRGRLTMDVDRSKPGSRGNGSLVTIHGFRVQSYGKEVSSGFKRALRRLAERGFDDPTCVVVKTASGNRSGITHAGGRYIPPDSSFRTEVMRQMQDLGMEPPSPPFIIAPGENTLYHEWGHHIDRTWSGDNQAPRFSFRWFSRYYQLCVPAPRDAQTCPRHRREQRRPAAD